MSNQSEFLYENQAIFRFKEPRTVRVGECVILNDRLDTTPMLPGEYRYHVQWDRGPDLEPEKVEASFQIRGPSNP